MWLLKNKFIKKIYPVFLQQLENAKENKKTVILWKSLDEKLLIIICVDKKFIVLIKQKDAPLVAEEIKLVSNLEESNWPMALLTFNEFKDIVIEMKEHAIIESSSNIIYFISNQVKNLIRYYDFNREQLESIYRIIITKNMDFFSQNNAIESKINSTDTWMD